MAKTAWGRNFILKEFLRKKLPLIFREAWVL